MKPAKKSFTKTIIVISSLVSMALALVIAINANRYIVRISENNTELYSAYKISELMKSFRSNVTVLEAKQRGYIITGDAKFLEAYKLKETETKTYLKKMERYFSGKPEEDAFYKLKDLTYKKLQEGKDLSKNQGTPAASNQSGGAEIKTMEEIGTTVDEINESLSKTTSQLLENSVEYVAESRKWSYLEIGISILIALAAIFFLLRDVNTRNRLESELRQAREQAENSAMMKELFMANMSHEIRTPMNAILGFTNLLQKTELSQQQIEYLTAVKASGSNLLNIINDILDFSKIEAGQLRIEKISFNITDVFDSMRVMFSERAAEKGIGFEIAMDDKVPHFLFGDPTRLTQILVNLTGNAIKFTGNGSVRLSCELKSIEHDLVNLVLRVKDSGIGIPADKLDDVFDRFNQGSKETTRKYGGTGLGLSIVKSLVEIQNGTISVKSKEGQGTEFTVHLSYPVSYETKNPNPASANQERRIGKKMLVLLAEDNVLNQKLASTYLEGFGLEVEIAENGAVAVEMLSKKKYNLVFMDMQMPVMDGYTAAKTIRDELKLAVPVIAMTAHVLPGEREKCLQHGMSDYISKPFREEELFEVVQRYLENQPEEKSEEKVPAAENAETKLVDFQDLYELARGNDSFTKEMIEIFIDQNPKDIQELEQAIAAGDYETIRAVSHRMKTSVGFMGLKQLLVPLNTMESEATQKKGIEEIRSAFAEVKDKSAKAISEMESERELISKRIEAKK